MLALDFIEREQSYGSYLIAVIVEGLQRPTTAHPILHRNAARNPFYNHFNVCNCHTLFVKGGIKMVSNTLGSLH